jgi:hypothetical protein
VVQVVFFLNTSSSSEEHKDCVIAKIITPDESKDTSIGTTFVRYKMYNNSKVKNNHQTENKVVPYSEIYGGVCSMENDIKSTAHDGRTTKNLYSVWTNTQQS